MDLIVVGGVAAILRGSPLTTDDVDVVYAATAENIARLEQALGELEAIHGLTPLCRLTTEVITMCSTPLDLPMILRSRFQVAALMALAALGGAWSATAAPRADHVVLVSVDGFRPDFYLDRSWPMPTVQQMARDGVAAEGVRGVFPSVTYPSHTTLVTGALPARHGVYYNRPFEPGGQTGRWYWEAEAIRVPTLWTVLDREGLDTAAVSWPVTVGAPIDWVLPEVWSLDPKSDRLGPMRETTRPADLWSEIEREATGRITLRTFSANYMTRDDVSAAIAAYLLETRKPRLLAVHLIASDHFQHQDGRESDLARRAVGAADRGVGAIVDAAERAGILERTAFVITGDHGFVDIHTVLAPNVWLAGAGLRSTAPDRGDWRATFHTEGGGATLMLRDPTDRATAERVHALIDALPAKVRKLFRVVARPELDAIGADPRAPFALAAALGISFTEEADGVAIRPATGGQHGYFPSDFPQIRTGFVGWGAGFRAGTRLHTIGLEDIAPLIAELLGVPFDAPDGVMPMGALRDLEP